MLLSEELLLLCLKDDEGQWEKGEMVARAAVGVGTLADLVFAGCLKIGEGQARAVPGKSAGHELLNDCLKYVTTPGQRSLRDAIGHFGLLTYVERHLQTLCETGVLKESHIRVVFKLFKRKTFPTRDMAPERALVERIRGAVTADVEAPVDAKTAVVVATAHALGVLSLHLSEQELADNKARLERIDNATGLDEAAETVISMLQNTGGGMDIFTAMQLS